LPRVVAPHEFFYLGRGIELQRKRLPGNLILLNTEQPSTRWFSKAYRLFPSAQAIWDIDYSACQLLTSKGFACFYLAARYVQGFEPCREIKELPRHAGTRSLSTEILHLSSLNTPIAERPIDSLFIGYLSPRRSRFSLKRRRYFRNIVAIFTFRQRRHLLSPVTTI
jgi:hypothetical protein